MPEATVNLLNGVFEYSSIELTGVYETTIACNNGTELCYCHFHGDQPKLTFYVDSSTDLQVNYQLPSRKFLCGYNLVVDIRLNYSTEKIWRTCGRRPAPPRDKLQIFTAAIKCPQYSWAQLYEIRKIKSVPQTPEIGPFVLIKQLSSKSVSSYASS